jgi:predicted phosphodiesterase
MRIAIVSDIHGNRTAFEAVLADLRQTSPDLILHGGDLADAGSSPAEIVDRIRDLGWQGVVGNTDEVLFQPESLTEFAKQSPQMQPLLATIEEMAAATREALGEERLAWLGGLPRIQIHGPMALVHASPESRWRAPAHTASDAELVSVYAPLDRPIAVYAHIHRAYVRSFAGTGATGMGASGMGASGMGASGMGASGMIMANTGSVSLSYDGDRRAAYLLLDDSQPAIRRVEYDVDREIKALSVCGLPHADWVAKMLASAGPQMP